MSSAVPLRAPTTPGRVLAAGQWVEGAVVAVHWRFGDWRNDIAPLRASPHQDRGDRATRSRVAREWAQSIVRDHDLGVWRGFGAPSATGRPRLVGDGLDVSISHSGDAILVAVARGALIGADVEMPPFRAFASRALVRRMCHPDEHKQLLDVPPEQRLRALARLWTAKEAIVKADGRGLAADLRTITPALASATGRSRAIPEAHLAILHGGRPHVVTLDLSTAARRGDNPH